MVFGLSILLFFQLAGEVLAYFIGGVVPGPVIGMVLIFVALSAAKHPMAAPTTEAVIATSKGLLANLGILFVPAGVGIVQHLHLIAERGVALFATIIVSTVATLLVTVWCYLLTKRMMGGSADE